MATRHHEGALDPVAVTARMTAAERARESARVDRLFDDPFAAALAGEAGQELAAAFSGTTEFDNPTVAVRTRFYDDALSAHVTGADGAGQLVFLAAGMDTRVYRLDLPRATILYEVDRPALLELKQDLLADARSAAEPRCTLRRVGVDLAQDWPAKLLAAGHAPALPTCWLVEGLTPYLTETEVAALLNRITALSSAGSHLFIDFIGRSLLDHPALRPLLEVFAARGAPWTFGTEHPEDLLAERGWHAQISSIGAVGNELGRWPFPDVPRGTPGVPQGYFVHGWR